MGWDTSTRRDRLPADWHTRRATVLQRDDHLCQIRYRDRCTINANQCDHIIAGDNHNYSNLQAACKACHARKTALEGVAARPVRTRPPTDHPGLTHRHPDS